MYKVMLADDEGIVIESLQFIIEKNFEGKCEIASAKTGRSVVELAETFRPDIAFMDIQMPGINGIDAMKEIRRNNASTVFIVLSAYDKFDYAKEAINLGVLEYLNKPVEQAVVVDVLQRAMDQIDRDRAKRSQDLLIREKLENVIPIIENNMIYAILFQDSYAEDVESYRDLLGIKADYGYMIVLEFGEQKVDNHMTNVVGAGVKSQSYYREIKEEAKTAFSCITGSLMANRMILLVPVTGTGIDYTARIEIIEKCRAMLKKLSERVDVRFRAGIGSVHRLSECTESYKEAQRALRNSTGTVAHIEDLSITGTYEEDYPAQTETEIFEKIRKGDEHGAILASTHFFEWMSENHSNHLMDIRLKVLEFVLRSEHLAFEEGGIKYQFLSRQDYLPDVMGMQTLDEIRSWFLEKITAAVRDVRENKQKQNSSSVEIAKGYILKNYNKDISLDDVSREVDISPYYFSKLFKEETGENFIEYLTGIRIEEAKKLLTSSRLSMKEICAQVGYADPNYFSRIFKKTVGVTPTEYKGEKA
ncbi:MAG: response regulator [Lachnospiraceae bacterium]|nr:response regulator [Lachnospiraceae bacterium]